MKKNILFAFLSITSLSLAFLGIYLNQKNGKNTNEDIKLIENSVSNDIFGKCYGEVDLELKEDKLCSLNNSLVTPKIGYQIAFDNDNTKISIRYTALISSLDCTAIWSRGLFDSFGDISSALPFGEYESVKAYSGITNGGEITYANEVSDDYGNFPYNYFVTYTLLDVPLDTFEDYYLDAYLTINDGNTIKNSKVGAVNIGQKDFFSYNLASNSLVFLKDESKKEASLNTISIENEDSIIIPSYYLDSTHRYQVTKINENAFKDVKLESIVLPNTINAIEENAFKDASITNLCYMGNSLEWDNVDIFDTNISNMRLYYFDKELSYCNSFNIDNDIITLSKENHIPSAPIMENITATCIDDGTCDYVTYCEICGMELERNTVNIEALGHDYDVENKTNSLGHSYNEHTCTRCGDYYLDSLTVDYTNTYDYLTLTTNSLYSNYKDDIINIYQSFYQGAITVLESESDYVANWNGNQEYLVASATFSKLSTAQAFAIANSFIDNYPEFFFLNNSIYYGSNGVYLVLNKDYYSHSSRLEMMNNIKEVEQDFTRSFYQESFTSDREKAKFIHDYVANHLFYQNGSDGKPSTEIWAHNIIGFMDLDETTGGVCECYSQSYLYLCRLVGIETILVVNDNHAWNYTKINGAWYGVDVTWDDQDDWNMIFYDYFLASKEKMDEEHDLITNNLNDITALGQSFCVYLPELSSESGY